jgi:hypothetical protein
MSARHFGIPSATAHHSAGALPNGARHHAPPVEARCNLSSFAADPSFPRSDFHQTMIDIGAALYVAFFVGLFVGAVVGAFAMLIFVFV